MGQSDPATAVPGGCVLVVDDVGTNIRLIEAHLAKAGYRILTARDGEEALSRIEEDAPDLVLLDVMMPRLDGFDTCSRIKNDPETQHIPVILLTSLNSIEDKIKGQAAGADDFITKPFERVELLLRVESMLRIKALHDQLTEKIAELEGAKRRLRHLADTDGLTLLYNKRYFDHYLATEVSRAKRYARKLSIVMLDIDHFKQFNDTHGHPTGDALLEQLATLLTRSIRRIDCAARYGGDEFALILPETPQPGAETVARRLHAVVESYRFMDPKGSPLDTVTVSVGAATFPDDAGGIEALIEAADRRLYRAKQGGRNRVALVDA